MIEEAIIYSVALVISVFATTSYLKHKAEIDSDTAVQKANAYANAQKAGYIAEAGALNFGNDSQDNGLGQIGDIVKLISDPTIQKLLAGIKKE